MKSRKFNDNWKEYVLYDLANWKNGLAFNKINFSEDGYPIIKIAELKNGITSQTNFTKDKCSEEVYLRKNDLIFSWSGNPETSIDAYLYDLPEGYLNQHSFKVTPYEFINKYFLFYILKYLKPIFKKIASNKQTTGLGHITISDLRNLKIKIPTIEIQEKFLKIIKRIDDKIKLNNQTNDNLQKLVNGLYIKYFVNFDGYIGEYKDTDLGMIPEIFNVDTLGNVITFSNGYGWNSKDMLDVGSEDTYKVFKMGNINIGGGINKSKTKSWIEKDKTSNLEQYITKKGDILMCMTDMKNSGNPLLGHTALIDKDDEFVINQRVGIIRCNKGLGYSYIYTMSNLKYFINDIRSRANSGVQVNLTTKGICDTLVLVPDDSTLNKFQQVVEPLYERIFNNNNENETLTQLRDTLLPKIMNGEIKLDKIEI